MPPELPDHQQPEVLPGVVLALHVLHQPGHRLAPRRLARPRAQHRHTPCAATKTSVFFLGVFRRERRKGAHAAVMEDLVCRVVMDRVAID